MVLSLDLTDEEIGGLLGMSRSAVQRRRTKTLEELRAKLIILRAFFVKVQQIGRSERGKGKPFQRARLVSSW